MDVQPETDERLRNAQRAEERQRATALKTARDAFLERFKIRAWDNTGNWKMLN